MSIPETFHFDNRGEVVEKSPLKPYFLALIIILVSLLSFGIGRLTGSPREGVEIKFNENILNNAASVMGSQSTIEKSGAGKVSASVNGTKYYYQNCSNNILEKNKVYFDTAKDAEESGYTLAANCRLK